jgi:hypothetical protein
VNTRQVFGFKIMENALINLGILMNTFLNLFIVNNKSSVLNLRFMASLNKDTIAS